MQDYGGLLTAPVVGSSMQLFLKIGKIMVQLQETTGTDVWDLVCYIHTKNNGMHYLPISNP